MGSSPSQQLIDLPHSLTDRLALLFDCLRQHRCLLLTSREKPKGMARLEGDSVLVRALQLTGLDARAGRELLESGGLSGAAGLTASLLDRHSGNPLALKLVSRTIQELFNNDIAAFLSEETLIFDDIREVLDQQFARLSALEQGLLIWLAIEREAVSLQTLEDNLVYQPSKRDFLEAIRSLQRRSLLETTNGNFTLQNVVIEYLTDYLIEQVCQKIETEWPSPQTSPTGGGSQTGDPRESLLNHYALIKAEAKEYVRQSQVRLILQPVANWLVSRFGQLELEARVKGLLERLHSYPPRIPGYTAGNLLNLLLHLGLEVHGYDFSHLCVWQAYLQKVTLLEVNFAGADLAHSVFTDTFGPIGSVAFSPDTLNEGRQLLAAGTSTGEIRLWQMADGQPYATLTGHTDFVWSIAFSPDGQTLASGSDDQTICLWDAPTGQLRHTLSGHHCH